MGGEENRDGGKNREGKIRKDKERNRKIWITSKESSSNGKSFQMDGPTTEEAQCCIRPKEARGTRASALVAE